MLMTYALAQKNGLLEAVILVLGFTFVGAARSEDYPLSLQLENLERDLTSTDYQAVLVKMIPTDLAAEWQRIATPDNHHLFAKQHGGAEKMKSDPALKAAYERREKIATEFLELIRGAYDKKKLKPPFADEAVLIRALESGAKRETKVADGQTPIEIVLPSPGAEKHWPCFRGPTGQGIVLDTNILLKWS